MAQKKAAKAKKPAKKKAAGRAKKTKTLVSIWFTAPGEEEPKELTASQFNAAMKKHHGITPTDTVKHLDLVLRGKELEVDPDLASDKAKKIEEAFAAVTGAVDDHNEFLKELAKIKEEEEKAKIASDQAFALTPFMGSALGGVAVDGFVDWERAVVGDKFTVTDTMITVNKDATVPETEAGDILGNLLGGAEAIGKMSKISIFHVGDMAIFIEANYANGEHIVNQVVKEKGQAKHTMMEAIRLSGFFKTEEDRADWPSKTHAHEGMHYAGVVPKAKWKKIKKLMLLGDDPPKIITLADGKEVEVYEPWSCAKYRKELKANATEPTQKEKAAGKDSEGGGEDEGKEEPTVPAAESRGFIYVSADGNLFQSSKFNKDAATIAMITADLDVMATVDNDGNESGDIEELDPELHWPVTEEEAAADQIPD